MLVGGGGVIARVAFDAVDYAVGFVVMNYC